MKHTPSRINKLKPNQIFVFGSNMAGIHGAGGALIAKQQFNAIQGTGNGIQGQSYGIPTKNRELRKLNLDQIKPYVIEFLEFAKHNLDKEFLLTAIGCGLAGNKPKSIAPMFIGHTDNIILPLEFYKILYPSKKLI